MSLREKGFQKEDPEDLNTLRQEMMIKQTIRVSIIVLLSYTFGNLIHNILCGLPSLINL